MSDEEIKICIWKEASERDKKRIDGGKEYMLNPSREHEGKCYSCEGKNKECKDYQPKF